MEVFVKTFSVSVDWNIKSEKSDKNYHNVGVLLEQEREEYTFCKVIWFSLKDKRPLV